ncbi:hypothetical protein LX32DRAFT_710141 [Colletotrichum zoysiae]|uniref:Uncharacterized protein n=1 Tax=Colletotrichum zoysiae TaxID=1216348 RepID=A0AAD9H4V6_9PEZI|nr:hypothetical protein LX32DRAFT_710141 [Colletotrichum zoysiae]
MLAPATSGRRKSSDLPTQGLSYICPTTLAGTHKDFSHFFFSMAIEARNRLIAEIDNNLHGKREWEEKSYDPLCANELCKTAFLILVERSGPMNRYGCYRCYTLQPEAAFDIMPPHIVIHPCRRLTVQEWKKDLLSMHNGEQRLRRSCIECGVRDGLYSDNSLVESMTNKTCWVCKCRLIHWVSPNVPYTKFRRCLGKSPIRPMD